MTKKNIALIIIFTFLINFDVASALEPCESGGIKTSVYKQYQMLYPAENFIRITNKDSLKNLTQLKDLICLQYLDATEHGIKGDIANLKKLTSLEVLSLYNNPEIYGDICSLSDATKLRSLKFAFDKKISGDISCLSGLNLETLAMTYTKISGNLSSLSRMTKLKALYLAGTDISGDISALNQLTDLEELGVSDQYTGKSKITGDLASLDNLKKLKKVSLYGMDVKNCQRFIEAHPDIKQGGCSEKPHLTSNDSNKIPERKINRKKTTPIEYPVQQSVKKTITVPEGYPLKEYFFPQPKKKAYR